jgi:hypothetical protein
MKETDWKEGKAEIRTERNDNFFNFFFEACGTEERPMKYLKHFIRDIVLFQ